MLAGAAKMKTITSLFAHQMRTPNEKGLYQCIATNDYYNFLKWETGSCCKCFTPRCIVLGETGSICWLQCNNFGLKIPLQESKQQQAEHTVIIANAKVTYSAWFLTTVIFMFWHVWEWLVVCFSDLSSYQYKKTRPPIKYSALESRLFIAKLYLSFFMILTSKWNEWIFQEL